MVVFVGEKCYNLGQSGKRVSETDEPEKTFRSDRVHRAAVFVAKQLALGGSLHVNTSAS